MLVFNHDIVGLASLHRERLVVGTTTTEAEAKATTTARTTRASATEDALGSAEEVQTIDDVEHGIARDGVVLGISTPHGRDNAGEC